MSGQESPIITLTVGRVKTLSEIEKWTAIAELIGIPSTSTVTVDGVHKSVAVTAFLAQVPYPEGADDDA